MGDTTATHIAFTTFKRVWIGLGNLSVFTMIHVVNIYSPAIIIVNVNNGPLSIRAPTDRNLKYACKIKLVISLYI